MSNLDKMIYGYMVCALWSSTDFDGNPLDDDYSTNDINSETVKDMAQECTEFAESVGTDFADFCSLLGAEQFGHDFWLTRNGHGAGFWDRGLGDLGKRLTDASKVYGGVTLYTHNGEVYQ